VGARYLKGGCALTFALCVAMLMRCGMGMNETESTKSEDGDAKSRKQGLR
jgi:hypothetical protein